MINIHKKIGETPLEALERLRVEQPELKDETLSYAGRLDPMAEGELLILVGSTENKERLKYLSRNKEYCAEFLIGLETDTGDVLGRITRIKGVAPLDGVVHDEKESQIRQALLELKEITVQMYPWFSSKTVAGRPLFEYAREGKTDTDIKRPTRAIEIFEVEDISFSVQKFESLCAESVTKIQKVTGDFRQKEIIELWQSHLPAYASQDFVLVSCRLTVSSGTYIRGLTETLAQKLGEPVLLNSLIRTKIL